jgi:hypothetical protein
VRVTCFFIYKSEWAVNRLMLNKLNLWTNADQMMLIRKEHRWDIEFMYTIR